MESVASKTARTSLWAAIERFANLGVNLLVQLVLARLLTPSDFGVVAMMTVFIGISQAVSECGMTNALIRKQDCSQSDYSTAFFLNFGISVVLYLILFFVAPIISSFYHMPMICSLLRVYAWVFILESLRIVQYAKLCKRLKFDTIAKISSASVFLSGIISVSMAYWGGGVWALIAQMLLSAFFYLLFISMVGRWLPDFHFDVNSFRYLWGFGSKMLLTGIISRIYSNIYSLIIGRFYNANVLGLFNNGQRYGFFYPSLIENIFVRNSLPIFSEYQDSPALLCDLYRKFIRLVSFLSFPICLLTIAMAKPIIILLLTEKWVDATIYLQIFASTALLTPANSINLNILQVKGRTDLTLKAEIIKKSVGFVLIFMTVMLGPIYLALTSCFISLFAFCVNGYCAKIVLGVRFFLQIKDLIGIFAASAFSAALSCVVLFFNMSSFMQILSSFIICSLIYIFTTKYILKLEVYNQVKLLFREKRIKSI